MSIEEQYAYGECGQVRPSGDTKERPLYVQAVCVSGAVSYEEVY
jgi:hypothetical protein